MTIHIDILFNNLEDFIADDKRTAIKKQTLTINTSKIKWLGETSKYSKFKLEYKEIGCNR